MVGAVLWGTAVLAAMCACLLLAASLASCWLDCAASENERALDIVLIAIVLAVAVTSVLLVTGMASLVTVTASCLALGGAALAVGGRRANSRLSSCWRAGLLTLRRSPVLWLLPTFALLVLARALALPQLSWDGLTYHLTYPATWIQNGGVERFEAGGTWEAYETFPKGGEALFYLAMLPFHADHLVNLVNLPLWLGIAIGVRACAQRLGVGRLLQDGSAVALALCPAFLGYITPAYVEVGSAFAFTAALSAALRALAGETRALVLMGLALGAAIAIKLTALSLLCAGVLVVLFCARRDARAAFQWSVAGALGAAAVCAPWYLRNALVCGNPLYPAALPGFVNGPRAGSLLLHWTLQESSVLAQDALGRVIEYLLAPPWKSYPLGPMALYPLALALPVLFLPACRKAQRTAVLVLLALALGQLVVYLLSPWNGIYFAENTRFLGPSLISAGLAGAVVLDGLPRRAQLVVGGAVLGCALAYVARVPIVERLVWRAPSLLLALGAAAWLCGSVAAAGAARDRSRAPRVLALLGGVLALAMLAPSLAWRERHRLSSYARYTDLHPLPPTSRELWPLVAGLPESNIAFAVGGIDAGEGWFFYPLFGAELQHAVRYVDVEANGERSSCARRGLIRARPSFDAWQRRLREQHIDYLAAHGAPLEQRWAEAHPELFALVAEQPNSKLFRVLSVGRAQE